MLTIPDLARAPLYLQVCELLARRIADGTWKPLSMLPNKGDLARELGVSTATVRKALGKMEAEHLVVRRQGKGTFVVDQASKEVANRFDRLRQKDGTQMIWKPELLQRDVGPSTSREQQRLQIERNEPVLRVRRLWKRDGRPLMLEDTSVPTTRLPGFQSSGSDDCAISAMAQEHGVHLSQAQEQVSLEEATPEVARLLMVSPATVLMRLDRVIWTTTGHPIAWRIGLCHLKDEYYFAEMG